MMDIARARAIVEAINEHAFVAIGLIERVTGSLIGVSLGDMLLAKRMVENSNRANAAAARFSGGQTTIYLVPDDRLIAAAYLAEIRTAGGSALHHQPEQVTA